MKTPQNLTLFPLIRRIACFRFQQKKIASKPCGGSGETNKGEEGGGRGETGYKDHDK